MSNEVKGLDLALEVLWAGRSKKDLEENVVRYAARVSVLLRVPGELHANGRQREPQRAEDEALAGSPDDGEAGGEGGNAVGALHERKRERGRRDVSLFRRRRWSARAWLRSNAESFMP